MTHLEIIDRIRKDIDWYIQHNDPRHAVQALEALAQEAKAAAKEIKKEKAS